MGKGDLLGRIGIKSVEEPSWKETAGSESPHYNSLCTGEDGIHHTTSRPLQITFKWLIPIFFLCYYFSITANDTLRFCYC